MNMAEGGAAYGQTEAVIRAVKHPGVDVIFLEQSSVIARNYLLFDGRLVPTVIYGRLIERFGKPIVMPTHNYAVLAAIDDYALAPGAISIGGHESKANFLANHGVRVQHDDNLLITGGYGPMGNGALKPDIIAPSNYVSTGRGFIEGTAIPGLMQLPPGYNIAGGTSTATPTTAGAVALLISAARQAGVKVRSVPAAPGDHDLGALGSPPAGQQAGERCGQHRGSVGGTQGDGHAARADHDHEPGSGEARGEPSACHPR